MENCNPTKQISSKTMASQPMLAISSAEKLSRAFSGGSLQSSLSSLTRIKLFYPSKISPPFGDFRNLLIFYNFIQLNVKNCNPSKQIFSKPLPLQRILAISNVEKTFEIIFRWLASKFLKFSYTHEIILLSFKTF